MSRQPNEYKVVTPYPFFNVVFGCSSRAFYEVKRDLYELAETIGVEIGDGDITEECDYEGNLERIVIYTGERGEQLRDAVINLYSIVDVPKEMDIVLSKF